MNKNSKTKGELKMKSEKIERYSRLYSIIASILIVIFCLVVAKVIYNQYQFDQAVRELRLEHLERRVFGYSQKSNAEEYLKGGK